MRLCPSPVAAAVGLCLALSTASAANPAQDAVGALLSDAPPATASAARQDPSEVRTTQALNAEVVAQNDLAARQEQADQESYVASQAQVDAEVQSAASADQARYQADQAAYLEAQARYEAAMADWRATAAACQRGDTRRCRAGRQPAIPVGY
jgi:hypothetical protein